MKTILVVDDEFDLTSTLRAILEGEGYGVETCANGREALEHLKRHKPDLLLMDVMMPILSGLEVLKTMKQTPGLDQIPVVLMCSIAPGVKRDDYPWRAFLRKPFSLEALMKTLEQLIGRPDREPDDR